jgi:hypothetical protein
MDGVVGGNPDDAQPYPNQTAVSWLGPPVNRWMMLYGGGGSAVSGGAGNAATGAIMLRFAEHPWGPWSSPVTHLDPGGPGVPGTPFGPGGWMFNPGCSEPTCAPSDPHRPLDFFFPGCPAIGATVDTGILYAPNVIDAYTRPDGAGGLDVFWNVSAWNPYLVALMRTNVRPGPAPATSSCARRGPRLRWCAKDGA